MSIPSPLSQAIDLAGGPAALARKLGCKRQMVSNWRRRGVPPAWCMRIEAAVAGQITCHQLLPDVFPAPAEQLSEVA